MEVPCFGVYSVRASDLSEEIFLLILNVSK